MLGASAFCERAISDQNILLAGVSEQSAIAIAISVGVGTMSGISTLIPAFTQTSTGLYITGSTNAELDFNYTKTSIGVRLRLGDATLEPEFTQDTNPNIIASGVATKIGVFTQEAEGDLLFVNINPAANETYTTINPSGSESWVEIET